MRPRNARRAAQEALVACWRCACALLRCAVLFPVNIGIPQLASMLPGPRCSAAIGPLVGLQALGLSHTALELWPPVLAGFTALRVGTGRVAQSHLITHRLGSCCGQYVL